MKLKTLKDIKNVYINKVYSNCPSKLIKAYDGLLKQEAIKWVKHCRKNYNQQRYDQIFKGFFNISEEDLKGGVEDGKRN